MAKYLTQGLLEVAEKAGFDVKDSNGKVKQEIEDLLRMIMAADGQNDSAIKKDFYILGGIQNIQKRVEELKSAIGSIKGTTLATDPELLTKLKDLLIKFEKLNTIDTFKISQEQMEELKKAIAENKGQIVLDETKISATFSQQLVQILQAEEFTNNFTTVICNAIDAKLSSNDYSNIIEGIQNDYTSKFEEIKQGLGALNNGQEEIKQGLGALNNGQEEIKGILSSLGATGVQVQRPKKNTLLNAVKGGVVILLLAGVISNGVVGLKYRNMYINANNTYNEYVNPQNDEIGKKIDGIDEKVDDISGKIDGLNTSDVDEETKNTLKTIKEDLEKANEKIEKLNGKIEKLTKTIEDLRNSEDPDLQAIIDDLTQQKDAAVAERDAAVAERDAAIAERDAAIAERDAAVAKKEALAAMYAELDSTINSIYKKYVGGSETDSLAKINAIVDYFLSSNDNGLKTFLINDVLCELTGNDASFFAGMTNDQLANWVRYCIGSTSEVKEESSTSQTVKQNPDEEIKNNPSSPVKE